MANMDDDTASTIKALARQIEDHAQAMDGGDLHKGVALALAYVNYSRKRQADTRRILDTVAALLGMDGN